MSDSKLNATEKKSREKSDYDSEGRDMREIYFRDPANNSYIPIPYRDRTPAAREPVA